MCVTQQAQNWGNTVGGGVCKSCALFFVVQLQNAAFNLQAVDRELRVTAGHKATADPTEATNYMKLLLATV